VDQISEQRHAAAREVDDDLREGGRAEHGERPADGPDAFTGSLDRGVDEPVRVSVVAMGVASIVMTARVVIVVVRGVRVLV
jgi:hypothetical protein